jgi:hypothetical protein
MIIPINEAELRKNTAQGAIAATIKPPIVGPATRPMLLARALRVRAALIINLNELAEKYVPQNRLEKMAFSI